MSLLSVLLVTACTVAFTTVALSVAFRIGLAQKNGAQDVRERLDQARHQIEESQARSEALRQRNEEFRARQEQLLDRTEKNQERWEHLLGRMEALIDRVEQQRKG
jgi:hypothetical protein